LNNVPHTFRHVRLQLARETGHPGGDLDHGYDLVLPLGDDGHIDVEAFRSNKEICRVRRFRPGEDDAIGRLAHGPGGRWVFDYGRSAEAGDESGHRLGSERFVQGEYVSVREDDGDMHTFVVTQVNEV